MRIKIIGDNNCARATRHLLRLAGFAVTEFLPADAVTEGPHAGYAITIELAKRERPEGLAQKESPESFTDRESRNRFTEGESPEGLARSSPAADERFSSRNFSEELAPATRMTPDARLVPPDPQSGSGQAHPRPEHPAQDHRASAQEEAAGVAPGASSPAFVGGTGPPAGGTGFSLSGFAVGSEAVDGGAEQRQAEACLAGRRACPTVLAAQIHFDSVESALEAAVLRHVTQLSAAPVVVDRPGGVVHSDRELRIVAPNTGDAKADEAAAVAIEFGVLRGLLDLTSPAATSKTRGAGLRKSIFTGEEQGMSATEAENSRVRKKKWWPFALVLLAIALGAMRASVTAAPRWIRGGPARSLEEPANPHRLRLANPGRLKWLLKDARSVIPRALFARGICFVLPFERKQILRFAQNDSHKAFSPRPPKPAPLLRATLAALAPGLAEAEPQGQFATGQGFKITDGTNSLVVDPCKGQTKSFASINQTANTQIVAGAASKKIYVCSIHVVTAIAQSIAVVEGTGSTCATGAAGVNGFGGATAATGWSFAANGGIALRNGDSSLGAEGTSGDNLCVFNSGSGQVSGGISYVVQ
jgi:hypothetical protein